MKIFADSPEPIGSRGSFRICADAINSALKEIGHLGTKEDCSVYLIETSCDTHLRHPTAKTAFHLAWELSLPPAHVARNLAGAIPIGCSKQVATTFENAGLKNVDWVHHGVDERFWKPCTKTEKFSKTTFLSHNTSNSRSGFERMIPAFGKAFAGNKDVRLIIKDRPNSKIQPLVDRISAIFDVEIILDCRDLENEDFLELYRRSHYHVYTNNAGSFCLTVAQSLGCGTPNMVTDGSALVEYMSNDYGLMVKSEFKPFTQQYIDECAKVGISNTIPLGCYNGEPFIWYPIYEDIVDKFKMAYDEIKSGVAGKKGLAAAEFVKLNLQWKQTALKLVEKLGQL